MNLSSTLEGNNICLLWFFTIQTSLKISLEDCQCLCFQDTQYETPYFTSIRIMIIKKERKKTSIGENGVVGLEVPGMEFGAAVEGFLLGISAEKGCY